jgi:hypothetical protein
MVRSDLPGPQVAFEGTDKWVYAGIAYGSEATQIMCY